MSASSARPAPARRTHRSNIRVHRRFRGVAAWLRQPASDRGCVRARRLPLVPPALGAYTAYLAHAGADWDWELAGVTLLAIIVGGACLASVEPGDSQPVLGKAMRGVVLFGALAISAFALVSLVGNQALVAGREALGHGNLVSAERQAKLSARLLPWSPDPWVTIGDAQLASGDTPTAQRS